MSGLRSQTVDVGSVVGVVVAIEGEQGPARARFEVEAAEAAPRWLALWPWFGWPVLMIVLFGIHQVLVRRKDRGTG